MAGINDENPIVDPRIDSQDDKDWDHVWKQCNGCDEEYLVPEDCGLCPICGDGLGESDQ